MHAANAQQCSPQKASSRCKTNTAAPEKKIGNAKASKHQKDVIAFEFNQSWNRRGRQRFFKSCCQKGHRTRSAIRPWHQSLKTCPGTRSRTSKLLASQLEAAVNHQPQGPYQSPSGTPGLKVASGLLLGAARSLLCLKHQVCRYPGARQAKAMKVCSSLSRVWPKAVIKMNLGRSTVLPCCTAATVLPIAQEQCFVVTSLLTCRKSSWVFVFNSLRGLGKLGTDAANLVFELSAALPCRNSNRQEGDESRNQPSGSWSFSSTTMIPGTAAFHSQTSPGNTAKSKGHHVANRRRCRTRQLGKICFCTSCTNPLTLSRPGNYISLTPQGAGPCPLPLPLTVRAEP